MTDKQKIELSLLSLNTMGAPFKPKIKKRYQEISKLLNENKSHFFALQETFPQKDTNLHILKPFQEKNFFTATAHEKTFWRLKTVNSGLTSLSYYPIIEQKFQSFRYSQSVDRFSDKGILLTRIQLPCQTEIDIYNTHLQASYLYRNQNAKTRIKQLEVVVDFIHKYSNPKNIVLVLGDFNFKEDTYEYDYFLKAPWFDAGFSFCEIMRNLHPCEKSMPLYTYEHLKKKNLKEKIDHKFLHVGSDWQWHKEESVTEILDWNVSDHHPIVTKLIFSPSPK